MPTQDIAQQERERYILAFNETMVKIWQEKITLLGIIDTGQLLNSISAFQVRADGRFFEVTISHAFLTYGLYQDRGTGKEVPRGNPGDIGRDKVRQRRDWFSKKYYASKLNLRDFIAENVGREFQGMISDIVTDFN